MRLLERLGMFCFGLTMVGFAIQNFWYRGRLAGLEFLPEDIPGHAFWTYFATVVLLVSGVSFLLGKRSDLMATVLGSALLLSTTLLAPQLVADPSNLRECTRVFEMLSLCGGAWVWAGRFARGKSEISFSEWLAVLGRMFLAVSMLVFGVSHLDVPGFIASLIPAWIPWRFFWAYFTALAFFAAGFSFGLLKWSRLAGLSLAAMFLLWLLVLHAPRVAMAWHNGDEWNSALVALAMVGCGIGVACLTEADVKHTGTQHNRLMKLARAD